MEYGIILFVGCLLGIVGINALGVSNFNLLWGAGGTLEKQNTLSLLAEKSGPGESSPKSGSHAKQEYYTLIKDASTGKPVMKLADGAEGEGTNVSSIEGAQKNVLGTLMISEAMSRLADEQVDPKTAVYYRELAKWLYYTGSVEGALDEVPAIDEYVCTDGEHPDDHSYTKADALRDIQTYRQTLKDLLNHPPVGIRAEDIERIRPLVNESLHIAQGYINEYKEYINKQGKVNQKVNRDSHDEHDDHQGSDKEKMANKPLDQLVSYAQIKSLARQVLSDNHVDSVSVESTLENAVNTETASTAAATTATP